MKKNTKKLLGIFIGVVIVLSTFVTLYVVLRPKNQLIEHDPIIIWNDDDFLSFDFQGDGSKDNPYLIQNYNITTDSKYSIYIKNTYKHFVIQNCFLKAEEYGIYLENIADGTAIIINNVCADNENGIFIFNSDNITISNNTCINNLGPTGSGISITDSDYCDITNNYCTRYEFYGIKLENAHFCYLLNNTCDDNIGITLGVGIFLFQSDNNNLVNNICRLNKRHGIEIRVSSYSELINNTCIENENTGIYLSSSPYSTITNNTCLRNKELFERFSHGINLYNSPYCNLTGNSIGSNVGNGIFLESSSSCIVTNNFIYNHTGYEDYIYSTYSTILGHAIYCYQSSNLTIQHNFGSYNYGSCWIEDSQNIEIASNIWLLSTNFTVEIYDGSSCTLQNNIMDVSNESIHLTDSTSNLVASNEIVNSEFYGLSIYGISSENIIHHNSFINNNLEGTSQGYDEGMGNYWFDNITKEGNFWSDWSGIGNYSIDGPANSEDPYCLNENPLELLLSFQFDYVDHLRKSHDYLFVQHLHKEHFYVMLLLLILVPIISLKRRKKWV